MKKQLYIWIADYMGLSSIIEYNQNILKPINLRKRFNPQKYITYGTVELNKKLFEYFNQLLKNGEYKKAWLLLGGTKEERIKEICKLYDDTDQNIINLLMNGFEITMANTSDENIIRKYSEMFENKLFQELH